ncbi:MAG: cytochrome c [Acidimicrobiia bacterium]|nr:cytochrome c [Acidimicrobiia bacterium]
MFCALRGAAGMLVLGGLVVTSWSSSAMPARSAESAGVAVALQGASKPIPATEATIKAGATVYARMCRSCHGFLGKGDGIAAPPGTKPANLVDAEWKHGGSDPEIFKNIREGIAPFNAMRPQKGLSDEEIWSVIHHLRALAERANKK